MAYSFVHLGDIVPTNLHLWHLQTLLTYLKLKTRIGNKILGGGGGGGFIEAKH